MKNGTKKTHNFLAYKDPKCIYIMLGLVFKHKIKKRRIFPQLPSPTYNTFTHTHRHIYVFSVNLTNMGTKVIWANLRNCQYFTKR